MMDHRKESFGSSVQHWGSLPTFAVYTIFHEISYYKFIAENVFL